jgi:hypothetical protein
MNRIDVLLKIPFSFLSIEEKLEIKELGGHQPRDFSRVVRIKIGHSPLLGLIRKDG